MSVGALQLPAPYRLIALETVDSTSDEAKRLARNGAEEGLIVSAKVQTAGRGRRGRRWISPPGNLYMSLVLRPDCRAADAAQLGFVTALGMTEAIDGLVPGLGLHCKWPNDLLARGKKIAGILLETEIAGGDRPDFLVIGIGVNLVSSPPGTPYPTTSLVGERVERIEPHRLLGRFVERFDALFAVWRGCGFAPIRDAWLARAAGLGEPIQVRLEQDTLDGRFLDLDDDGALMLETPAGRRRIAAGEVFPVTA